MNSPAEQELQAAHNAMRERIKHECNGYFESRWAIVVSDTREVLRDNPKALAAVGGVLKDFVPEFESLRMEERKLFHARVNRMKGFELVEKLRVMHSTIEASLRARLASELNLDETTVNWLKNVGGERLKDYHLKRRDIRRAIDEATYLVGDVKSRFDRVKPNMKELRQSVDEWTCRLSNVSILDPTPRN